MKNLFFFAFIVGLVAFASCKDDDAPTEAFDYGVHFHSPNSDDKHIGDSLHIEIEFHEHNGGIVHHANVRLYNKATGVEIINGPTPEHVHQEEMYTFEDDLVLDSIHQVEAQTDWILVGSAWGETDGESIVKDSIEFHVHPK